jgi:hypothetical protein
LQLLRSDLFRLTLCLPAGHRTWLKKEDLQFQIGDFVAVFYPKSYKATIYVAQVLAIEDDILRLHHWPKNDTGTFQGHPYYRKASEGQGAWTEGRRFWRLVARLNSPQAVDGEEGVYSLSVGDSSVCHRLGRQFALS